MTAPDYVLLDCEPCGRLISVPVLRVDEKNEIHVDHDWLAEHHATHDEENITTGAG